MVRIRFFSITCLTLLCGFFADPATRSIDRTRTVELLADPVEGSYKLKAITINPGIDYGKDIGVVTDMLAFSLRSGNSCVRTLVVTFHGGGKLTTGNLPTCTEEMAMGFKDTGRWVHTNNTLVVTELDGKQTNFALSFSGSNMRLTGKVSMSGNSSKPDHELTMTLIRQ